MTTKRYLGAFAITAVIVWCVHLPKALAQTKTPTIAAEKQKLNDLKAQVSSVKKNVESKGNLRKEAGDQLAEIDQRISEAGRTLARLNEEKTVNTLALTELTGRVNELNQSLVSERDVAARILRATHQANLEAADSGSRVVLEGATNAVQVERMISYYKHLATARATAIARVNQTLSQVTTLAAQKRTAAKTLDDNEAELKNQSAIFEAQRNERGVVYERLNKELVNEQSNLEKMQRDEMRLVELIAALQTEQMREARAKAAREKEAAKQLAVQRLADEKAQKAAERLAQEQQNRKGATVSQNPSMPARTLPSRVAPPAASTATPIALPAVASSTPFVALKGQLTSPALGRIVAGFGAPRAGSAQPWRGLVYRTAPSAPVNAVAAGQVVFADWLRGFGNIVIVDHGGGFLTVYSFTETILTEVGDNVSTGTQVATTGVTPFADGKSDTGLYFELRQGGTPVNPTPWFVR